VHGSEFFFFFRVGWLIPHRWSGGT
jgi:hypothetical protein